MRKVSGTMRLDLAQYRELEAFAQFGSELDKASQQQLDRGVRVVEVLKQPQFSPVPVEEQVAIIWAVTNGKLDDVPVADVRRFESELMEFLRSRNSDLMSGLRDDGQLGDDRAEELAKAVDSFRSQFQTSATTDSDEPGETADLDTLTDSGADSDSSSGEGAGGADTARGAEKLATDQGADEGGPEADADAPAPS
jgi:F-type H+/Na+-transporting ATPase subunit alpha